MNTTYMKIVNNVLEKINEVPLSQSTFASPRGVHAMVKQGVLDTIMKINQTEQAKWPFYAVEQSLVLNPSTQEYAWPDNFASVDWKSFQIQKDDTLDVRNRFLIPIEREQWYRYLRDRDYDQLPNGVREPEYVFSTHGFGYGLSPSPDRAYTLKYRYFKNPVLPELWDDEIPIPSQFDYVIHAGGLWHAYVFYDNSERAATLEATRDAGIRDMVRILIGNNFEHVYAGQVINNGVSNKYMRI